MFVQQACWFPRRRVRVREQLPERRPQRYEPLFHRVSAGRTAVRPRWARLMPHLLAADLAATGSGDLRRVVCAACRYLLDRGDTRTGHDLASSCFLQWRQRLNGDHEDVMMIAYHLAWAYRLMGRYAEARDLDRDTLDRRRRVPGEDHPYTLDSALTLANDLRFWVRCRRLMTWTRTPWTAAAGCSARTTPTPWPALVSWPPTCARPRSLQGMACVRSGQAAAWPLVSGRSVRRAPGSSMTSRARSPGTFCCARCPAVIVMLEGRTRTLRRPSPDRPRPVTGRSGTQRARLHPLLSVAEPGPSRADLPSS
jgi:hypothetical protein